MVSYVELQASPGDVLAIPTSASIWLAGEGNFGGGRKCANVMVLRVNLIQALETLHFQTFFTASLVMR
jgi:hypothetical protein